VRTDLPSRIEHIIAYAGSAAIAPAGYGLSRGVARIIGCFWLYAATLTFRTSRAAGTQALVDFAASAFGALCGGLAVVILWRCRSAAPGWRDVAQ
jgi:hypothetical protein